MHFAAHLSSVALILSVVGSVPACVQRSDSSGTTGAPKAVDFVTEVKPILHDRCIMCHNRGTLPDRTSFENGALAKKGDRQGPVILPGNAAGSRLITAVASPDFHEKVMPPVSVRVTAREIELLRRWIDEGAEWPAGPDGEILPHSIPLE